MIQPSKIADVGAMLSDVERVTSAVRRAAREARMRHKQLGVPLVVWQGGQVVSIPPEEIVVELPNTTATQHDPHRKP
jgi:hypothetical protein